MHDLEKCKQNGTLISSSPNAEFDTFSGIASFNNLNITQKGMYLILVKVKTINSNDYIFKCLSKPILVKSSKLASLSAIIEEKNIHLTFNINFTSFGRDSLKIYETMIYNCIVMSNNLSIQTPISFNGETISVLGSSGTKESYTKLIASLNNFSLSHDVILKSVLVNQKEYTFSRLKQSDDTRNTYDSALNQKEDAVITFHFF